MTRYLIPIFCFVFLLFSVVSPQAYQPWLMSVYDLPNQTEVKIDSIVIQVNDAFEGSRVNSRFEEYIFDFGNSLHFKTRSKTVKKYLLFSEGDSVSKIQLIESERNLRNEKFFADAKIELEQDSNQSIIAHVTVFDQWTTVPGTGVNRYGNQWTYWIGLSESNFFGTGQKINMSYYHKLRSDGLAFSYIHTSLTKHRLRFSLIYTNHSNGFGFNSEIKKPLLSKKDRHGFSAGYFISKNSIWYYFDGNSFEEESYENMMTGQTNQLAEFTYVLDKRVNFNYTRSYGINKKFDISLFSWTHEKQLLGDLIFYKDTSDLSLPNLEVRERDDVLFGVNIKLYQKEYTKTSNLRNVKWAEDFDRVKLVSFIIGRNITQLGAENSDLYFGYRVKYSETFNGKHYVSMKSDVNYFLSTKGEKEDGSFEASVRYQVKFKQSVNGLFSTNWKNYIGRLPSEQLKLGDLSGLHGYPNFYYSGHAMLKMNAELVMISNIEVATIIPAFSVFVSTGNTFTDYQHVSLNKLHTSVGLGLRFGVSRSVDKTVNHFNISWPLDKSIKGPIISIRSKTSL